MPIGVVKLRSAVCLKTTKHPSLNLTVSDSYLGFQSFPIQGNFQKASGQPILFVLVKASSGCRLFPVEAYHFIVFCHLDLLSPLWPSFRHYTSLGSKCATKRKSILLSSSNQGTVVSGKQLIKVLAYAIELISELSQPYWSSDQRQFPQAVSIELDSVCMGC